MPKDGPITREFGENLAVQALAYLAQDPERLARLRDRLRLDVGILGEGKEQQLITENMVEHAGEEPGLMRRRAEFRRTDSG